MAKKLIVIDKNIGDIAQDADFILNLSARNIIDKRTIDFQDDFKEILEKTKKDYPEFVCRFGKNSGFIARKIMGSSLWWFSEIQHKDSFWDTFFRDIVVIRLIEHIRKKLGIDKVTVFSDNTLLENSFGQKKKEGVFPELKFISKRIKLLLKTLPIAIFFKKKRPDLPINNVFFSFFPSHWFNFQNIYMDRFLKSAPYNTPGYAFAVYLDKNDAGALKKLPERSMVIQSFLTVRFLLAKFIDFSHYLWYLRNRKKIRELSYFCGIDIWPVYKKYIIETTLYNDLFYSMLIQGLKNIISAFQPKNLIAPGEFGPETKALAASCSGSKTKSVWYQHTPFCRDKLWLLNHPEEVKYMPVADKILVWSEYYKNFLYQSALYPEERCKIVENIKYSDFAKFIPNKSTGQDKYKKYLFAPTVSENEFRHFCYFISELCKDGCLSEERVILKLHPSTRTFFDINKIFPEYPRLKNIEILLDMPGMESFTEKILCVITGGTTLGIEAAFFGIPVIQYIPKYGLNWSPLDEKLATCFSDINSLRQALKVLHKTKPLDYRLFYMEPVTTNKFFQNAIA